jgi:hypothetical protein
MLSHDWIVHYFSGGFKRHEESQTGVLQPYISRHMLDPHRAHNAGTPARCTAPPSAARRPGPLAQKIEPTRDASDKGLVRMLTPVH